MHCESNFESLTFDPFSKGANVINNDKDPDVNFYNGQAELFKAEYYLPEEAKDSLECFGSTSFSVVHLNIRSMKKKLRTLKIC